jgi:predicted nuclease of predicted toxin-antitoxin system
MKFKLDENFGPTVHEVFQRRGMDCQTVAGEGLGGADDPTVMAAAVAEGRILVTLDRDFTNVLLYPPEATAGVAVVRLGRRASRQLLANVLDSFLTACENQLIHGKLWILEPGRIREHRSSEESDLP